MIFPRLLDAFHFHSSAFVIGALITRLIFWLAIVTLTLLDCLFLRYAVTPRHYMPYLRRRRIYSARSSSYIYMIY